MANRFWVGGTGTWDLVSTTHWSATSGGASGVSAPTSSDDVFFDASSGGGTVTIGASVAVKTLTLTGFTGSFAAFSTLTSSGNVNLGGKTLPGTVTVGGASTVFTSGGGSVSGFRVTGGASVNVSLADALSVTGAAGLQVSAANFDANNKNISATGVFDNTVSGTAHTITMGSGTWTITGSGTAWDCSISDLTIVAGSSTIKFTDASSADKTFNGGSKTYNNVWFTGAGTGAFIVGGSNTFNDLKIDTPPHTLKFEPGVTTVTTFTVSGSASAFMTLQSNVPGTAWDIVSLAAQSISYVLLSDSHAHGSTFTDTSGADAGGNTGWTFVSSFNFVAAADGYFDSFYVYSGSSVSVVEGVNWLIGETVGVLSNGADIGDAVVSAAGKVTLPGSHTGSVVIVGKRYNSYAETLRAPQTGNQDGSSLGRQMVVHSAFADILDTPYLKIGTLAGTERIPHADRRTNEGDAYTGMFPVNGIDDKHDNNGVVVFETDKGYAAIVRAIQFGVESEP